MCRKFSRLPTDDRWLVVETVLTLALARIAIVVLPLRGLGELVSRPIRRPEPWVPTRVETIRRIRWAIATCASRVPWRAMCFEQGLAAHVLLRRRGIPVVLYFGAAPADRDGLAAHAWVRDGEADIVGCEIADRFPVLISFPRRP